MEVEYNNDRTRNRNTTMSLTDEQKKKTIKITSIVGCVVVAIIVITLVATSLKKLEENEYGLLYNRFSKFLDDEADSGGLFTGPPGFKFITFPSTFVTVDLDNRFCVSRDGLIVEFSVTFQYQLLAENMFPVVEKYRDFDKWNAIVTEAGLSAIHHSCSDFQITNFQNKRGEIQESMLDNLRIKLEGSKAITTGDIDVDVDTPEDNNSSNQTKEVRQVAGDIEMTTTENGVYAQAISLQLRNLEIPSDYSQAVRDKQSAEEDIQLAQNQRQQETTKARTALLRAQEEARKILDNANNDVSIFLTEARLSAEETTFAFQQEALTIVNVKESLGLTTNGVLAYLSNDLLAGVGTLKVTAHEPARLSRSDELDS